MRSEPSPTPGTGHSDPGHDSAASAVGRRSWWVTGALALFAVVLYGRTLCPTVGWYDSAEFAATAASLRVVPHPPGYPLYAILGHIFTWLPGEAALGVNVMSAVFGVGCVALLHRVALRFSLGGVAAAVPAALFVVAPSVWANAVVAEVYMPGLAFLLTAVLLCQEAHRRAQPRFAWAAAGVAGLGLGVHMSIATWGLGFAVLVGRAAWPGLRGAARPAMVRTAARWGLGCALATAIGASVLLLVPFGPFEAVTPLGPYEDSFARLWARFIADVQGGVFQRYFKPMPVTYRLQQIGGIARDNVGVEGLLAAVVGLAWAVRRWPWVAAALALGAVGNVAFFFRYDVPDLDVFLLPALVSLMLLSGIGVEAAFRFRKTLGWAVAAMLLILVGGRAARNYDTVDRSTDRSAREYGESVCAVLPADAILAMTSRPDEWRLYSVVFYMHESGEGCTDVEFWGIANVDMIDGALKEGRRVYAFVPAPRFGWAFSVRSEGPLYRVSPS